MNRYTEELGKAEHSIEFLLEELHGARQATAIPSQQKALRRLIKRVAVIAADIAALNGMA